MRRPSSLHLFVTLAGALVPGIARAQTEPPPLIYTVDPASVPLVYPTPGLPRLHIDAEKPVTLKEETRPPGEKPIIRPVCEAPCDQIIDGRAGQRFFFGGRGVTPSKRFQLGNERGDLWVRVKPGSSALRGGGIALTIIGSVAALVGLSLVLTDAAINASESSPRLRGFDIAGVATAAAGLPIQAGGIVMLAMSSTTYSFLRSGATLGVVRF
jgi:hypothetical protein